MSTRTRRLLSWKRRRSNRSKQTDTMARPDPQPQSGCSILALRDSFSCTGQMDANYLKSKTLSENRDQTAERIPYCSRRSSGSTFRIRTCRLFVSWFYAAIVLLLLPLSTLNISAAIPLSRRSESPILPALGRRALSHRLHNKGITQFSNAIAMNLSNLPACDPGTMTGFNNRRDEISQDGPIRVAGIHHGKKSAITEEHRQNQLLATRTDPEHRPFFFFFSLGTTPIWDVILTGAKDAASITETQLDMFVPRNGAFDSQFMVDQIISTANSGNFDGMFVSIPNAEIAGAVMQVQRDHPEFPIVVINVGLQSAKQQRLLAVMQDEMVAGEIIGNALLDKGMASGIPVWQNQFGPNLAF